MTGSTYAPAAAQVRGGHPADRPGGRPRRGGRLPVRDRHGQRSPRTSSALTDVRAGAAGDGRRACGSSARPRPMDRGGDDLLRARRHPPARRRARSSTSRASRSGSGTTAPGRSACGTEFPRPPGRRSTCTPRRPRSTRWSTGLGRSVEEVSSGDSSTRCTRRSSWTTTSTRTGAACGSRTTPRCTTSTRRAATRSPCGCSCDGDAVAGRLVRGPGLLDQPGLRLRAERAAGRASRWTRRSTVHEAFLELMQGRGEVGAGRGGAGGRGRVRRGRQVPGPGQVRAAELDGVQGRDGAGAGCAGPVDRRN